MIYALLTIVALLLGCSYLYAVAVDARRERDRLRKLYVDAMNELAASVAERDERDVVIERQMEAISELRQVRGEYVASLLDGRIVERSWQKWEN